VPTCHVLLVDDYSRNYPNGPLNPQGTPVAQPNIRQAYRDALSALGINNVDVYDVWLESGGSPAGNGPPASLMTTYEVVIWFSGDKYNGTGSAEPWAGPNVIYDQIQLDMFLQEGGRLFLDSQDYIYDTQGIFGEPFDDWSQNYLGAFAFKNDSNSDYILGELGNPVGHFFNYSVYLSSPSLPPPQGFTEYADQILPTGDPGVDVAFVDFEQEATCMTVDKSSTEGWRTVFFATSWYPIFYHDAVTDPKPVLQNNGTKVLERIMDFLCPPDEPFYTPEATSTPGSPTVTPTVTPTPTPPCIHDGDVNNDGQHTGLDAQLAFDIGLGRYIAQYWEECAADCNNDTYVTASDVQSIFLAALGYPSSCVDPIGDRGGVNGLKSRRIEKDSDSYVWIDEVRSRSGSRVEIEVMVDTKTTQVDVFTLDVGYDEGWLRYVGCEEGDLNPGWIMFGGNASSKGTVTISAFASGTQIPANTQGSLARLIFEVKNSKRLGQTSPIRVKRVADDLRGADFQHGQLLVK
jgi:hypothetical protein